MMARTIRIRTNWLSRLAGAALLLALLAGLAGNQRAFAAAPTDDHDVVTYGPTACTTTTNLPAYPNATCIKHKTEQDDDGTKTKNEYGTPDTVDAVRRAYETAFDHNGWTLVQSKYDAEDQEWEYTVTKDGLQVEVKVEAQEPDEGAGTAIEIEEQ
jgi:hypothetical protein